MRNEDLLGVPFQWGGAFPEGLDCFGLMVEVRQRCGIQTPDFSWVYQQWDRDAFDPHRMTEWAERFQPSDRYTPGAFCLREGARGPCLVTGDGTSAFYIHPSERVAAVPIDAVRSQEWRV